LLVTTLFFGLGYRPSRAAELLWLAVGNALYYLAAVVLAAAFRDNRAFCKLLCPVPMLQKPAAAFAVMKQEVDIERCVGCGLCEASCPMEVPLLHFAERGQRVLSTECILCSTCNDICPTGAVRLSNRLDSPSAVWSWARTSACAVRSEIASTGR
jgi:formate hydrogenlyase subunit 6/NADH:ubiquinone oxidoreductase subunit I